MTSLQHVTRYYDPSFRSVLAFDPAAAERLLDEAGWTGRAPDGIRTRQGVRLYSAAQQRLTELVPAVPVFENHTLVTFHRDVRGVVFDTSHNTPFFTTAWLDRPAR